MSVYQADGRACRPCRPRDDALEALMDHLDAEAACLEAVAVALTQEATALRRMDRESVEASARAKATACEAHAHLAERRAARLQAVCPQSSPKTLSALLESVEPDGIAPIHIERLHALRNRLRAGLAEVDCLQRLNVASAESGLAAVRGARRLIARMGAGGSATYSRAGAIEGLRAGALFNRRG